MLRHSPVLLRHRLAASALLIFAFVVSFFFVMIGYTSFFISPAAAPGRIALGVICFLLVTLVQVDAHKSVRPAIFKFPGGRAKNAVFII